MPIDSVASVAGDVKPSVEQKLVGGDDLFLSRRIASLQGKKEPAQPPPAEPQAEAKPEAAPETQPVETPTAEATAEQKEQAKAEEVLSKLDLGSMSEAELNELAEKLGSKAVARYGELTFKRKQAEEKAAALQAELARISQGAQAATPKVENNPYASVEKLDDLAAKRQEAADAVEELEEVLFKASDLSINDIAATIGGKEYTKVEIRQALSDARKARDKYIPAQIAEVQAREARKQFKTALESKLKEELPWVAGEDNDVRKAWQSMVGDGLAQKVKKLVPEIEPQLDYLLAHAANSIHGRRTIESFATNQPKVTPPAAQRSVAAPPSRVEARTETVLKDIESRFKRTGSESDWVALRAGKLSAKRP